MKPLSKYLTFFFNTLRCIVLPVACWTALLPFGLAQSKTVEKANELYKFNQFADAATLYEQALQTDGPEGKNTLLLKSKLAYCYRMNNKMDKAEALYAQIVTDEKAKSDALYYYGEALMSNGKYDVAKMWFLKYTDMEPGDENARKMILSCDEAPFIKPFFPKIAIQPFAFNSTADDNGPVALPDGIVFSSDRKQGLKLMKEKSGWTGRDYLNLYISKKSDSGFAAPVQFSAKLSEVNKNTGNASFIADGSQVFFTRNDNELNKQSAYSLQLYSAESTGGDRWKNVEKLSFCAPNFNFMHPAVSPDGQWLFFTSNKSGGQGGTDLWVAHRKGADWETPENLGPAINTSFNEGFPFADATGRLFFCSKGHPGFGGFDVFVTEKDADGQWKTPVNVGTPINSSLDDISIYLAAGQRSGMFTSSREGGDDDIYLFETVEDDVPGQQTTTYTGQSALENMLVNRSLLNRQEPDFSENEAAPAAGLGASFEDFTGRLEAGSLLPGERFRLDGAIYDPGIWQLTPRIAAMLDRLAALLAVHPLVKVEISAHTEAPGDAAANLELSENRAGMITEYLLREGLPKDRFTVKGCGEKMLLNHCSDEVPCTPALHLANQRLEVKVLAVNGRG